MFLREEGPCACVARACHMPSQRFEMARDLFLMEWSSGRRAGSASAARAGPRHTGSGAPRRASASRWERASASDDGPPRLSPSLSCTRSGPC